MLERWFAQVLRLDLAVMCLALALVCCVLAASFIASAAGGVAASQTTATVTAEYKGTYSFEDHYTFQGTKLNTIETYKWDETLTEVIDAATGTVLQKRTILDASGKIHQELIPIAA